VEARASACPPVAEQLATLRALLRTDLFERCLAERFPHSKARAGRPPARPRRRGARRGPPAPRQSPTPRLTAARRARSALAWRAARRCCRACRRWSRAARGTAWSGWRWAWRTAAACRSSTACWARRRGRCSRRCRPGRARRFPTTLVGRRRRLRPRARPVQRRPTLTVAGDLVGVTLSSPARPRRWTTRRTSTMWATSSTTWAARPRWSTRRRAAGFG